MSVLYVTETESGETGGCVEAWSHAAVAVVELVL